MGNDLLGIGGRAAQLGLVLDIGQQIKAGQMASHAYRRRHGVGPAKVELEGVVGKTNAFGPDDMDIVDDAIRRAMAPSGPREELPRATYDTSYPNAFNVKQRSRKLGLALTRGQMTKAAAAAAAAFRDRHGMEPAAIKTSFGGMLNKYRIDDVDLVDAAIRAAI